MIRLFLTTNPHQGFFVNPAYIVFFHASADRMHTIVHLHGLPAVTVRETPGQIAAMIDGKTQKDDE